ncbi:MAG: hypothetical protein OEX02_08015, partial [Cyclobacteriaceae bacterium]|nr:hypothetical protein [Cyclobacteriaceae bacterium]
MFQNLSIKVKLFLGFGSMALITALISGLSAYYVSQVGDSGDRVGRALAPLGDAAMEIKLSATEAHLLFEEIMGGDDSENVEEVYGLLDESIWYANAIANGGANDEGVFIASKNPEVRRLVNEVSASLESFKAAAVTRNNQYLSGASAAAGSKADALFDQEFEKFIALADDAETIIQQTMDEGLTDMDAEREQSFMVVTIAGV